MKAFAAGMMFVCATMGLVEVNCCAQSVVPIAARLDSSDKLAPTATSDSHVAQVVFRNPSDIDLRTRRIGDIESLVATHVELMALEMESEGTLIESFPTAHSAIHITEVPAGLTKIDELNGPVQMADPVFEDIASLSTLDESVIDEGTVFYTPRRRCVYHCVGVGRERVFHAPFEIETTQPQNIVSIGVDLAYDFQFPNRAEYLWASPERGPGPENNTNYQDFRLLLEMGSKRNSLALEIPIRGIDPDFNANHAGMGDMKLTAKTVFLSGNSWQLAMMLRAYVNTGSVRLGLGTGHASLEPGFLARYKIDNANYIHGAMKYWVPIGGDPIHRGEVLSNGVAWSHLNIDRDTVALVSSVEAKHWTITDGQQTTLGGVSAVDGVDIFALYFGGRLIHDTGSELGLVEYGGQWGTALGGNRLYKNLLRFNVRFAY